MLRFVEVFVVLVLISKLTINFPVAVKNSGGCFRDLSVSLVSPRFVFIVGNLIVITLFAKSGQFSGQNSTGKGSGNDLYEEFLNRSEKNQAIHHYRTEYLQKQRKTEQKQGKPEGKRSNSEVDSVKIKNYQRSSSEKMIRPRSNKPLRRSETVKFEKSSDLSRKTVRDSYPEDHMSNEEFQNIIESFIERQKRFLRDEEYILE